MLQDFLTVGQQVLILAVLISTGFICTKKGVLGEKGVKNIIDFVLLIVNPCVIINSFYRDFEFSMAKNLLAALILALFAHLLNICISWFFIRDKNQAKRSALRFGIIFSNCGFMGIPLVSAIVGSDGVFFCTAYICIFNILLWTFGVWIYNSGNSNLGIKKIFINPGMISIGIGLLLFFLPINLPHIILNPIRYFAAMNTPLPMVVIGFNLAQLTTLAILKDKYLSLSIVLRLIVCPLIVIGVFHFLPVVLPNLSKTILSTIIVCSSCPAAGNTTMFAMKFNGDNTSATALVSISTLFSILTIPLILTLAL